MHFEISLYSLKFLNENLFHKKVLHTTHTSNFKFQIISKLFLYLHNQIVSHTNHTHEIPLCFDFFEIFTFTPLDCIVFRKYVKYNEKHLHEHFL